MLTVQAHGELIRVLAEAKQEGTADENNILVGATERVDVEISAFSLLMHDAFGNKHLDIVSGDVVVSLPKARTAREAQIYQLRDVKVIELAQEIVLATADEDTTLATSLTSDRNDLIALESTLDLSGETTLDDIAAYLPSELG